MVLINRYMYTLDLISNTHTKGVTTKWMLTCKQNEVKSLFELAFDDNSNEGGKIIATDVVLIS